jgi:molybdate transport system ATP-binding protein
VSWRLRVRAQVGALALDVAIEGGDGPVALVGPNGCGKTTLLRMIAGARRPDEGEIEVGGVPVFSTARALDVPCEARGVGYVPQGYGLFPHLSVLDNVAFGVREGQPRRGREEARALARVALAELGAEALAERRPATLSGGEQQRVALARALIRRPRILLLDEPLSALDAVARRSVRRFLAERLRALGRPSIIVTHDIRDIVALDAPIHVLEGGRIIQSGRAEALRAAPASEFVAELLAVEG